MIKVYLVEDQALVRDAVGALLSLDFNIEVIGQASNGQDALNAIKALPDEALPDIILTDIEMPEMDGVKLISYIRNKLSISKDQLPILAYSSRDDIKTINQAKEAGCNAYYTKPKDIRFIARNISKWILTLI